MSRISRFILFIILPVLIAACAGAPSSASSTSTDTYVSPNMNLDYENALPVRMQFSLGTLILAETKTPVTQAQAEQFLPLWQALLSLSNTGNSASAEVNSLLGQIEAVFSAEQLSAIADMKLTFSDMTGWAAANGITLGSGSGQPGQGQGMSPEARATRQAENGKTAQSGTSSGASSALTKAVIAYLETLK